MVIPSVDFKLALTWIVTVVRTQTERMLIPKSLFSLLSDLHLIACLSNRSCFRQTERHTFHGEQLTGREAPTYLRFPKTPWVCWRTLTHMSNEL
jgi:hypothetical protein